MAPPFASVTRLLAGALRIPSATLDGMFLEITTSHQPATDLGYLLHKSPARPQSFSLGFGTAHVFYPDVSDERCTAALFVEVDPIGLVRRPKGSAEASLVRQYVNDRPYASSSFLSTAIAQVYGTALGGRCNNRPELAVTAIPLEAHLPAVATTGGAPLVRELFEPLGYTVEVDPIPLDPAFPEWGASGYVSLRLSGTVRLQQLLAHLYVLLPVLDGDKHYWVSSDEVDKLLRKGEGWLETHPKRAFIVKRYLRWKGRFVREALERLIELEGADPPDEEHLAEEQPEEVIERPISLNEQRLVAVLGALKEGGARTIADLGCGEGKLLERLARDGSFARVLGMDVTYRAVAAARSNLKRLPAAFQERVEVVQGSLFYGDSRFAGFDAITLVEVLEHLEPARHAAFERTVFRDARPRLVLVTTPNVEYNVRFEGLAPGARRHTDHRFEWTRAEFAAWTDRIASQFGYRIRILPIGPDDPETGPPTQMAVFERWNS